MSPPIERDHPDKSRVSRRVLSSFFPTFCPFSLLSTVSPLCVLDTVYIFPICTHIIHKSCWGWPRGAVTRNDLDTDENPKESFTPP